MRLYYYQAPKGNVGDDINPLVMRRLLGNDYFSEIGGGEAADGRVLFGIGSVLADFVAGAQPEPQKIVFGSGARSKKTLPRIGEGWDLRFVRGPLTAGALGGVPFITDPAVMLPLALPGERGNGPVGFVPYYRTDPHVADAVAKALDLEIVSPHLSPDAFVSALTGCRAIVSEAMHGCIIADAYRVPWLGVRLLSEVHEGATSRFKWQDWMASLDLDSRRIVTTLPGGRYARRGLNAPVLGALSRPGIKNRFIDFAARRIGAAVNAEAWQLSEDAALDRARDRILAEADRLKRDAPPA